MTTHNALRNISIKQLYTLALAEGEGVGTAYEYFAKRLVLRPWLKKQPPIKRMLVAGLPEKYGSSLDHLLLAEELAAEVVVVDERPEYVAKLEQALAKVQALGWLTAVSPTIIPVKNLTEMAEVSGPFDLVINNEVLQRIPKSARPAFGQRQIELGTAGTAVAVILFCPNADNPDHAAHSGLATLSLSELVSLASSRPCVAEISAGYIDMPPFPTGVTRSETQRSQAESGHFEAFAMWGLGIYARLENYFPNTIRCQKSHIIYASFRLSYNPL